MNAPFPPFTCGVIRRPGREKYALLAKRGAQSAPDCNFQLIHFFFFCSARELFQRAGGLFPSLLFFHCDIFVFTQQHLDLRCSTRIPTRRITPRRRRRAGGSAGAASNAAASVCDFPPQRCSESVNSDDNLHANQGQNICARKCQRQRQRVIVHHPPGGGGAVGLPDVLSSMR